MLGFSCVVGQRVPLAQGPEEGISNRADGALSGCQSTSRLEDSGAREGCLYRVSERVGHLIAATRRA